MSVKPPREGNIAAGQGPAEQRGMSPISQIAGPVDPPPRPSDITGPQPPIAPSHPKLPYSPTPGNNS